MDEAWERAGTFFANNSEESMPMVENNGLKSD
jgi:hypothetical protein